MGWTLLIAAHAGAALVCLLLGGYQLARRIKGDRTHRLAGWVWVAGMLFVASSSFAIRDLREGQLSLLHLLSVVTLVSMLVGVVAVRRGNVAAHRGSMRGSWFGLGGAFIGAVAVPGRLIPTFAVTEPLGALAAGVTALALTAALIALAHGLSRLRVPGPGTALSPDNAVRHGSGAALSPDNAVTAEAVSESRVHDAIPAARD